MDKDIWIGSVCLSVTFAKQGLILVISKGSDKNMLVPNMPPHWQFMALRGPHVQSHMLIFSVEQSSVYAVKCTFIGIAQQWVNGSPERQKPFQVKRAVAAEGKWGLLGLLQATADSWHCTTMIREGEMQYFT